MPNYYVGTSTRGETVLQRQHQDRLLLQEGAYTDIHPTRPAVLLPWATVKRPSGLVEYEDWCLESENPDDTMRWMKEAILFQQEGVYFNPARVNDDILGNAMVQEKNGNVSYVVMHGRGIEDIMIAVSGGRVRQAEIRTGNHRVSDNSIVKRLYLTLHDQEFQLAVGRMGMVLDCPVSKGDYVDDAIGISTKRNYDYGPKTRARTNESNANGIFYKKDPLSFMKRTDKRRIKPMLSYVDEVPIYDARKAADFSLATHLNCLETLPRYEPPGHDIPDGSPVIVGYTIGAYRASKEASLPYMRWNLQWVIVLDLPR